MPESPPELPEFPPELVGVPLVGASAEAPSEGVETEPELGSLADELPGGEDVGGVTPPGVDAPLVAGAGTVAGMRAGKRTRRT